MTRRVPKQQIRQAVILLAGVVLSVGAAQAQDASTQPNYLPQPGHSEAVPIGAVSVTIRKPSGEPARDAEALAIVQRLAAVLEGEAFDLIRVTRLLARMEKEAAVAKVDYDLLPLGANAVRLRLLVDATARSAAGNVPKGVLAGTGALADVPILYQSDRSLLTAIVAGGIGLYSDDNAWFGQPALFNQYNPLAGHLPGASTAWTEGSLELGAGFAAQLGDAPLYAFGALTGMKTWSIGQDIYTDETRNFDKIEKAYAGLLYADASTHNYARLSLGGQTFTLNDGFLVNLVKGSVNAGDRGATYLGPRLASQFSVLADGRIGPWVFNAFYIDPSELAQTDTHAGYLGANVRYAFTDTVSLDATAMIITSSDSTYANPYGLDLPRQGTSVAAAHVLWRNLLVDGIFLEAELGREWNPDYAMSAWGGYGTIGYIARKLPWTPSISFRYAAFTGDDPGTKTYERWDPMLNSGLGIWLQGISFGKITTNSNLATQRIQLNLVPVEQLNVTFDYHRLTAPELNNLGSNPAIGTLTSHQLGHEFTLTGRWAINRNLYLQSVASLALPGEALRDIGADRPWSTLQLSFYWGL